MKKTILILIAGLLLTGISVFAQDVKKIQIARPLLNTPEKSPATKQIVKT